MLHLRYKAIKQEGFTVLEMMITIALAGIIIPSISVAMTNINSINYRARNLALANMIAQNKVELLRSAGFNSVPVGTTVFTSELPNYFQSPKSANYVVSSSAVNLKNITVTISYNDQGNTRSISYKTFISELGVGQ